ncbi:MAG TPA: DinB family protein [Bacteroides sp.]|nr:DinB family protein [Bacteroides sp.]
MVTIYNEIRTFESLSQIGMNTLTKASSKIIDQLTGLVVSFTDEQYTRELPVLMNNSIGKHYRHIIEFYGVMLAGLDTGRVNYDKRKHDKKLEQNLSTCIKELKRLKDRFFDPIWQEPLELSGSYSMDSNDVFSVSTNAERELLYNIEHAVHHMAIIRIAVLHEFPELDLDDEFGYATSTLKYLRKE